MPLDIEQPDQLIAYLRATGRVDAGIEVRPTVLAGGVSNRTVLVELSDGRAWVLKQALAKLRVAVDWFSDPARIEREALGMKHLAALAPPGSITPLLFVDAANHLLAMEAVPQPHENWKAMLMRGEVRDEHIEQFAGILAAVHRNGREWRAELRHIFDDRSFFQSLRLEPYYQYAAAQAPEAAQFLHELVSRTLECRWTLVHGDFSPKNVLVHDGRLVLLDHEVIHFGDGAFDIGFAMTLLLSKAHHHTALRAQFAAAAELFWKTYRGHFSEEPWIEELERQAARQTLGCLMARVAGRSPLEYLDAGERARQRRAVAELMHRPPETMDRLIAEFLERISE